MPYPAIISSLPRADIPLEGVTGWLMQGADRQAVFFDLPPGTEVPPHSHAAQWGIVIDGEIELTIGGETRRYHKGDTYEIGDGVAHGARCVGGARVLDLFDDPARYRPKNRSSV